MRIERIKVSREDLGDVDWICPAGPAFLFLEEKGQQRLLGKLLLELFYQDSLSSLISEISTGLLEAWVVGENARFYIQRNYPPRDNDCRQILTQVTEMITGQTISLPESISLGDYIFGVNLQSFCQGVIVDWPKKNSLDQLHQRIDNLRQGGDEEVSLIDAQASLAGAQKKVGEQLGNMTLIQTEYTALRRDWEASRRRQDEERLLQIEIKKLQENEAILSEKIQSALLLQERLALLSQNPDYRELRQLQTEIIQFEEQIRNAESNLTVITSNSEVDWALIEGLREECLEWANLQEQVDQFSNIIQYKSDNVTQLQGSLQTCGYAVFSKDDVQRLQRAVEERDAAEKELNNFLNTNAELERSQVQYSNEAVRLRELDDIADVTEEDELKVREWERQLAKWQNSRLGSSLDRTLRSYFNGTSIGEKLASRLARYYDRYHVSNFEEFASRLKNFRTQQMLVEKLQIQVEGLQKNVAREDSLHNIVYSRTKLLNRALLATNVEDFLAWLKGWKDYQIKKQQLSNMMEELQSLHEESSKKETKLRSVIEQLREKLNNWETTATNREEVLATVFNVAAELRMRDDAERKIAELSQRFKDLLGSRNMEVLVNKLEPLAELEHEARVSDDDRLKILTAWQKEQSEIHKLLIEAEQRLPSRQNYPSLAVLEEKIESVKQEWMTYESLQRAIQGTQGLLEASLKEWQTKYGNLLNYEMNKILSSISSSQGQKMQHSNLKKTNSDYFAYRMAIAKLVLCSYREVPLLFSVGEINERERFWDGVIGYLKKLSLERQIIFTTTDLKLREKLNGLGWSSI
ncbi:hypothetical protein [Desulfosporosinus sp. SB140]|uniref:hypothetical protein n=1 Tax=Desulfosporosinus paludis TaxID=3115649 RepID=UPI00388D787B